MKLVPLGEAPVTDGPSMKPGDMFTIEGCGIGAKGQTVVNGYNPKTRRKCKAVTLTVFKVGATKKVSAYARLKCAIEGEENGNEKQ